MRHQQAAHTTLLQADADARRRAVALEAAGKLPPGFVDRHYQLTPVEQVELRRLKAAAAASVDPDTFVALCRGEAVPVSRLNPRIVDHHYARLASGR